MAEFQPASIGRIVHYRARGSADGVFPKVCRAAIITAHEGPYCASLAVLNPTGMYFDANLTHDESGGGIGGSWHWHHECADEKAGA